jgi:ATPase subunit of ABC transporter with duplicated ATPase domains
MSGGERRRVALAALLVRASNVLVLDEPTNHLDIAGIDWLAAHLATRGGALVVVTHDRWFLDAVCDRIWEVADETVRSYDGGYAAWVLARAERARVAAAVEARRQNLLRKEIAWLRRGPPARTSKPKFRIDAAKRAHRRRTRSARLDLVAPLGYGAARQAGLLARRRRAAVSSKCILSNVDWIVGPGDRIGIVGGNGAGKSTLLRVLAGAQAVDDGDVRVGSTVRAAFLTQELADLPGAIRVLEAVEEVARRVNLGGRSCPRRTARRRLRVH